MNCNQAVIFVFLRKPPRSNNILKTRAFFTMLSPGPSIQGNGRPPIVKEREIIKLRKRIPEGCERIVHHVLSHVGGETAGGRSNPKGMPSRKQAGKPKWKMPLLFEYGGARECDTERRCHILE
ncbi:hypothetical protein TNCV_3892261 [Trichonephila clavipes]|nr:hypothetical protein TNCV_3892261 [Trichonephila clavipes]